MWKRYNEEEFKAEVAKLYGEDYKLVGKYISISKPVLIQDKYGIMRFERASLVLQYKPSIVRAIDKNSYAMNMLKDKQPEIYSKLTLIDNYTNARDLLLFNTAFGLVKASFDTLMAGHMPSIRSAVNRKEYFKNQLKMIYGDRYDFKIQTTNRHEGKSILICPIHGDVVIDNDYIFTGKGCPKCNNIVVQNVFYYIKLTKRDFFCYKIGISHYTVNNRVRRYYDYARCGFKVDVIKEIKFDDQLELKLFETKIKREIKDYLVIPPGWPSNTSTECFSKELFDIVLHRLHDIV